MLKSLPPTDRSNKLARNQIAGHRTLPAKPPLRGVVMAMKIARWEAALTDPFVSSAVSASTLGPIVIRNSIRLPYNPFARIDRSTIAHSSQRE